MVPYSFGHLFSSDIPDDLEESPAWQVIGGMAHDAFTQQALAESYLDAATALSNNVLGNQIEGWAVIYPILFNLRQGIELYLKLLVDEESKIYLVQFESNKSKRKVQKNNHDLTLRIAAFEHKYQPSRDMVTWLEDINRMDRTSMLFRFSDEKTEKEGGWHLKCSGEYFINLERLITDIEQFRLYMGRCLETKG